MGDITCDSLILRYGSLEAVLDKLRICFPEYQDKTNDQIFDAEFIRYCPNVTQARLDQAREHAKDTETLPIEVGRRLIDAVQAEIETGVRACAARQAQERAR